MGREVIHGRAGANFVQVLACAEAASHAGQEHGADLALPRGMPQGFLDLARHGGTRPRDRGTVEPVTAANGTVEDAVTALRAGLPVVLPTDTVYGLAVDPTVAGAVESPAAVDLEVGRTHRGGDGQRAADDPRHSHAGEPRTHIQRVRAAGEIQPGAAGDAERRAATAAARVA